MNTLTSLSLDDYRWRGFWKEGVENRNGSAAFTVDGLRYYRFWHRQYRRSTPRNGMPYDDFALEFFSVMKLHNAQESKRELSLHALGPVA